MTPNDVLAELRAVAPETLSPGQLCGRLVEAHPGVTREVMSHALRQLERVGLAREVRHWEWVAV